MGAAVTTKLPVIDSSTDKISDTENHGRIYTGLANFGTTCYCNSVIQSLYYCSPFRQQLFEYDKMINSMLEKSVLRTVMPTGTKRQDALLLHLTNLFYELENFKKVTGFLSPHKFISEVKMQNLMFNNDEHHDAHEFLHFLLNDVIESIRFDSNILKNRIKQKHCCIMLDAEKTWVENIFGGTVQSKTKCLTCERVSVVNQAVLDISIETSENSTLSDCLLRSTNKEYMQDIDKVFCECCNSLQESERSMRMVKSPKVLAIHLKRFKFVEKFQQHRKLQHKVEFSDTLDFHFEDGDAHSSHSYRLRSVIAHLGNGPMEGHYVAMVRDTSCSWTLFDDDIVEKIDADLVKMCYGCGEKRTTKRNSSQTGYILFYEL